MSRPWMPLYVADYLADTAELDAAESGAYLHLIMHYWLNGGLPADEKRLARIAKMTEREWAKARATIAGFFGDGWRHNRIDAELLEANEKYERRAMAGRKGGNAAAQTRQSSSNATDNATAPTPELPYQPQPQPQRKDETDSRAVADATRTMMAEVQGIFDEFWLEYPKREGANPKAPALKSFLVKIATGKRGEFDRETATAIIAGAKRYAAELRSQSKYGTPYVARAVTFLNEQRWKDYPEVADVPALPPGKFYAAVESPELDAWDKHFRDTRGRGIPRDKAGGWLVDSQWPPGHVLADGGQNTEARAQPIELR